MTVITIANPNIQAIKEVGWRAVDWGNFQLFEHNFKNGDIRVLGPLVTGQCGNTSTGSPPLPIIFYALIQQPTALVL